MSEGELDEMRRQFNNMLRYNNERLSEHEVQIFYSKTMIEVLEERTLSLHKTVKTCLILIIILATCIVAQGIGALI